MLPPKRLLMYGGRKETVDNGDTDSECEDGRYEQCDLMLDQMYNDSDPLTNRGCSPRHTANKKLSGQFNLRE